MAFLPQKTQVILIPQAGSILQGCGGMDILLRTKIHSPQGNISQETVAENHCHQGTNFRQTTVYSNTIYSRCHVFILNLEKQLVGVVVERHIADPRHKYWNFLQN